MTAKRGLYANINARRRAGLKPKKPGDEGYPDIKAFKQSAKTAHDPNSRINLALKRWDVKC